MAEIEVPEKLRKVMFDCCVSKQISYDWLVSVYQEGFKAGKASAKAERSPA